jgi:quercetin dioxygenase-like cupin family protein
MAMELNADFGARAVVHAAGLPWVAAPAVGVHRRMLDRLGDEVARATSIVRYAPGSSFPAHVHGGGEEFLVLEGVFADESGDMPAGTYVRNPPGTSHAPASPEGCIIFVKLWQFDPGDRTPVRLDTTQVTLEPLPGRHDAVGAILHRDGIEEVRLEQWDLGAAVDLHLPGGGELLVLNGSFLSEGETFERMSWLRLPAGADLKAVAGEAGSRLWVKTGHLQAPVRLPSP